MLAIALGVAGVSPRSGTAESISVEVMVWGDPLYSWQLNSDGSGRFAELRPERTQVFGTYRFVTRSFRVSPAEFRRVALLLRPARSYAGRELPCTFEMTDQDAGSVRWRAGTTNVSLDFNYGCTSPAVAPIYQSFRRAHD